MVSVCVTPYGAGIVFFSIAEMGSAHPNISEWESLSFQQLPALLFVLGIALASLFMSKDLSRRSLLVSLLLVTALTIKHNRFFILFVIVACLVFCVGLRAFVAFFMSRKEEASDKSAKATLVMLLAAFVGSLPFVAQALSRLESQRFETIMLDVRRYPVQAVQYLKERSLGPNLGIQFDWGGYAIWHLYPNYKVSIDGRYASVYGAEYADRQIHTYLSGDLDGFVGM